MVGPAAPSAPPAGRGRTPLGRRTPLALRNVLHEKYKSATAIAGISFAIILILMQLGFLEVVKITATNIFEQLDFDVILLARQYEQLYDAGTFPRQRLGQARAAAGVEGATAVLMGMNLWRCPPDPFYPDEPVGRWQRLRTALGYGSGAKPIRLRGLFMIGFDLDDIPFEEPLHAVVAKFAPALRAPRRILFDERSHPDFGWRYRAQPFDWELGRQRVEIVGSFSLGGGFGADATVLCSEQNFALLRHGSALEQITLGLLKVEPGQADRVAAELARSLPPDTQVFTRAQMLAKEQRFWVRNTSTGVLFGFGVFVAVCVGTVVVYQVLSNDVTNHFAEYATLKAIGYTNGYLARVVTSQAILYAALAFLPALGIAAALYRVTQELANIPMRLTAWNVGLVFVLSVAMCLASALLTMRRVWSTDPAELF